MDNPNRKCYTCKRVVLCKMPLILLKTEKKNVIYEILDRESILYHEKAVYYKMCLNVQKSYKWVLCTVSEKENVHSVNFLVLFTFSVKTNFFPEMAYIPFF